MTNPYNCSAPGNLFVGYAELLKSFLRGLRDGKSYALLGGRRCGKTSLLMKLQEVLRASGLAPFQVLPRFFDIHAVVPRSPFEFFSRIYALTTEGLRVPPWDSPPERQHYQEFLSRLDQVRSQLEQAHGPRWLVVLLIDELDAAPESLHGECFQNFRNLLTESRYKSHFRVVASGCSGMGALTAAGSPLNNLDPKYTRILSPEEAHELLITGFPEGLEAGAEAELLARTGRHPYALQGVLELLFDQPRPPTQARGRAAAWQFSRDRIDTFKEWREDIREEGRACFGALARAGQGTLRVEQLRAQVASGLSVFEGLKNLSYHGLIDEEDGEQPRIAGTIFKDWFLDSSHGATPAPKLQRDQVFISYSSEDSEWLERLEKHLKPRIRSGKLDVWSDQRIKPGVEWRKEIDQALARAKVAVLLVSPDFVASEFIAKNELPPLLEAAKQGGVTILWVPVNTAAYKEAGIDIYQAAIDPRKPLKKRHHAYVDDAMEEICEAISKAFSA
jgi:hypothetical protein